MDKINLDRISKLHPCIRAEVEDIVTNLNINILTGKAKVRITQGLRTFAEQDALYQQGRTIKGAKVTNASAGQSYHNYGLAVDFCLIVDGKAEWSLTKDFDGDHIADWQEVVKEFKRYGFVWGGDFKSFKDYPHFEKTYGYSWKQLKEKYTTGKTIINNNITYVNI